MKVLFFSNDFPRPWEPLRAVFNLELVRGLAERHELRVVSPAAWTERRNTGVNAAVDAPPTSYPVHWFPPRLGYSERGTFMWWSLRRHLLDLARTWTPDLVLAYWTHPDGEVALRLARRIGVPMVQMVGGSDVLVLARQPARRRRIRRVLALADAVVAMGRHLGRAVEDLGVRPERLLCLYRPVDPALFSPGDRTEARRRLGIAAARPVVLWVGRFEPVKGLRVLVEALSHLRNAVSDVFVCLVGEGPQRRDIEGEVRACGLGEHVRFAGGVVREHLADWYRAADVAVLPSLSEGIPNVLLEARACGIPFVASDVGGIAEIAGAADRLVPPGDSFALAEALAAALRFPRAVTEGLPSTPEGFHAALDGLLHRTVAEHRAARSQ